MQQAKAKLFERFAAHRVGPMAGKQGRGNGDLWKARKTIVRCFPTFPQTLEIAPTEQQKNEDNAGAIPTFPPPGTNC
jgi:hypothetical protein